MHARDAQTHARTHTCIRTRAGEQLTRAAHISWCCFKDRKLPQLEPAASAGGGLQVGHVPHVLGSTPGTVGGRASVPPLLYSAALPWAQRYGYRMAQVGGNPEYHGVPASTRWDFRRL